MDEECKSYSRKIERAKQKINVTAHRVQDLFGVFAYLRDQPGLRMQNTLHQSACENPQHPASSNKDYGKSDHVAYPVSSYV